MSLENSVDYLVALLVIMVVALQVQIIKINRRLGQVSGLSPKN